MKLIMLALSAMLTVSSAMVIIQAEGQETPHLLGTKVCTQGPSYWCQNLTTSAGCQATKHCIAKVWQNMEFPEDNDNVCHICKDMVKQARDQLESNQTQEDLKTVFESSCKLMYIKPIVKECIKLADEFIPDLVETLASQMNPSVVCSVAGLCNSPHIDQLLARYEKEFAEGKVDKSLTLNDDEIEPDECSKCYTFMNHMEHQLKDASKDDVLKSLLLPCRRMSSFSDACSAIIVTHFDTIYDHLLENFNPDSMCHLSGQCSAKFHQHEDDKTMKVDIRPLSSVGMVEVGEDLPCKLCEQLVGHLRDILVANTTEAEFKQVLLGLCKQTKSFKAECISIVDQYYPEIYEYLTRELDSKTVCMMSGICPSPDAEEPISPLLPHDTAALGVRIINKEKQNAKTNKNLEADAMQLPIERMIPIADLGAPEMDTKGKQTCAFCEYVLHTLQEALTNPITEEKVREELSKICTKLGSLENQCEEFIGTYGAAVVAILAQEMDPSVVCPKMRLCPSDEFMDMWEKIPKDFMLEVKEKDKPSCPLCLLAIAQVYDAIKNNKTEASIEAELNKLCNHLPKSLSGECQDLVKGYSKELIEKLLDDLSPQEICTSLKLCDPSKKTGPPPHLINGVFPADENNEIITNEIPAYNSKSMKKKLINGPIDDATCVVCEFAMNYIEKAMSKKKNRDEVEKLVHGICNHLPRTVSTECNQFVDKYADMVISLLSQEISPKQICTMIDLCKISMSQVRESVAECALCKVVISKIDRILADPKVDRKIEDVVEKICDYVPGSQYEKCVKMVDAYGQSIINLIERKADPRTICTEMALCSATDNAVLMENSARPKRYSDESVPLNKRCTWGASYWCASEENAIACKAMEVCKDKLNFSGTGEKSIGAGIPNLNV